MLDLWRILLTLLLIFPFLSAQETYSHSVPEKLGKVSFPISCNPAVQEQFDRGVALLHSFTYTAAENAFQGVAERDPRCVPMQLLRAGVKLASLLPAQALRSANHAMQQQGIPIDLTQIKPENEEGRVEEG